jgi:hypothetical protein
MARVVFLAVLALAIATGAMFGVVVFGNEFTKDIHPRQSSHMNSVTLVDFHDNAVATADVQSYVSLLDLPLLGTAELNKVDGITYKTYQGIHHKKVTGYQIIEDRTTVDGVDAVVPHLSLQTSSAITIEVSVSGARAWVIETHDGIQVEVPIDTFPGRRLAAGSGSCLDNGACLYSSDELLELDVRGRSLAEGTFFARAEVAAYQVDLHGEDVSSILSHRDEKILFLQGDWVEDGHPLRLMISQSATSSEFYYLNGTDGQAKLITRNGSFSYDSRSKLAQCMLPTDTTAKMLRLLDVYDIASNGDIEFDTVEVRIEDPSVRVPHAAISQLDCLAFLERATNISSADFMYGGSSPGNMARRLVYDSQDALKDLDLQEIMKTMHSDNPRNHQLRHSSYELPTEPTIRSKHLEFYLNWSKTVRYLKQPTLTAAQRSEIEKSERRGLEEAVARGTFDPAQIHRDRRRAQDLRLKIARRSLMEGSLDEEDEEELRRLQDEDMAYYGTYYGTYYGDMTYYGNGGVADTMPLGFTAEVMSCPSCNYSAQMFHPETYLTHFDLWVATRMADPTFMYDYTHVNEKQKIRDKMSGGSYIPPSFVLELSGSSGVGKEFQAWSGFQRFPKPFIPEELYGCKCKYQNDAEKCGKIWNWKCYNKYVTDREEMLDESMQTQALSRAFWHALYPGTCNGGYGKGSSVEISPNQAADACAMAGDVDLSMYKSAVRRRTLEAELEDHDGSPLALHMEKLGKVQLDKIYGTEEDERHGRRMAFYSNNELMDNFMALVGISCQTMTLPLWRMKESHYMQADDPRYGDATQGYIGTCDILQDEPNKWFDHKAKDDKGERDKSGDAYVWLGNNVKVYDKGAGPDLTHSCGRCWDAYTGCKTTAPGVDENGVTLTERIWYGPFSDPSYNKICRSWVIEVSDIDRFGLDPEVWTSRIGGNHEVCYYDNKLGNEISSAACQFPCDKCEPNWSQCLYNHKKQTISEFEIGNAWASYLIKTTAGMEDGGAVKQEYVVAFQGTKASDLSMVNYNSDQEPVFVQIGSQPQVIPNGYFRYMSANVPCLADMINAGMQAGYMGAGVVMEPSYITGHSLGGAAATLFAKLDPTWINPELRGSSSDPMNRDPTTYTRLVTFGAAPTSYTGKGPDTGLNIRCQSTMDRYFVVNSNFCAQGGVAWDTKLGSYVHSGSVKMKTENCKTCVTDTMTPVGFKKWNEDFDTEMPCKHVNKQGIAFRHKFDPIPSIGMWHAVFAHQVDYSVMVFDQLDSDCFSDTQWDAEATGATYACGANTVIADKSHVLTYENSTESSGLETIVDASELREFLCWAHEVKPFTVGSKCIDKVTACF